MVFEEEKGMILTVAVSKSSVVIGHSDEVIAAWRFPIGHFLSQQTVGEVQIPGETGEYENTNPNETDLIIATSSTLAQLVASLPPHISNLINSHHHTTAAVFKFHQSVRWCPCFHRHLKICKD